MSKSGKIALGGLLTALGVVLMFLTGLIPIGTYALPAIAGVLLIVAVIEIGAKWAWMIYAAVAVLSLLFAADKEAALLFVLFFPGSANLRCSTWLWWPASFSQLTFCSFRRIRLLYLAFICRGSF